MFTRVEKVLLKRPLVTCDSLRQLASSRRLKGFVNAR